MRTLKYSRQRECIKNFLTGRTDHPTADFIYENIRQEYPNISLGTVYRNLSLLNSIGEIMKVSTGDGADHYDGQVKPHNHFICKSCHSVIDLDMENIDFIKEAASQNFDGEIETYVTNFYGHCKKCLENQN